MKFKTVIEHRLPRKRKKDTKILIVPVVLLNIIYQAFLPFISGYYLATTRNFYWIILFFVAVFFEIRFSVQGDTIKINIMRGL